MSLIRPQNSREAGRLAHADTRHVAASGTIRKQQLEVGHEACFASDRRYTCSDYHCQWRTDCVKLIAAWRR